MMCHSSMISTQHCLVKWMHDAQPCSPNCEWKRSLNVSVISPGLRPWLKAGFLPHFHT
jgi:hypothetical protein